MISLTSGQRKALVGLIRQWGDSAAELDYAPETRTLLVKRSDTGGVWAVDPDGHASRLVAA